MRRLPRRGKESNEQKVLRRDRHERAVAAHLSRHDDSAVVRVYKKIIGSEIIPLYVDSQSEKLSPQGRDMPITLKQPLRIKKRLFLFILCLSILNRVHGFLIGKSNYRNKSS